MLKILHELGQSERVNLTFPLTFCSIATCKIVKITYASIWCSAYRSRLDRAYAKQVEIQKNFDYNIFPVTFSDHDAIFIKIKWGPRPKWGKGSWKMNTQVLADPRFELGLKQIIVTFTGNV